MIDANQFVNGIWMGCVLIALGLAPGLLQDLNDAIVKFVAGRMVPFPVHSALRSPVRSPRWFAAAGVALIVFTSVLYSAR